MTRWPTSPSSSRRKSGDSLKGQTLDKDFYGIGIMAGRFTNLFDEINMIAWGMGGDVISDDGTPGVNKTGICKSAHLLRR